MQAVESIVDGTWGGPPPPEWVDFSLMKHMPWTFAELRATPPYVVRFCYDFLRIIGDYEAEQAAKRSG